MFLNFSIKTNFDNAFQLSSIYNLKFTVMESLNVVINYFSRSYCLNCVSALCIVKIKKQNRTVYARDMCIQVKKSLVRNWMCNVFCDVLRTQVQRNNIYFTKLLTKSVGAQYMCYPLNLECNKVVQ